MLQIKFPVSQHYHKKLKRLDPRDIPDTSLDSWKGDKPRMSSARLMIEVRRRLWIEVCSENTGSIQTDKIMVMIKNLTKRIEKRCIENLELDIV